MENGEPRPKGETSSKSDWALKSVLSASGEVSLRLAPASVRDPTQADVVVHMEAAPLNPTDISLMLAGAEPETFSPSQKGLAVDGRASPVAAAALRARHDKPLGIGMEGAGIVVAAGASAEAQALLGRRVAVFGGGLIASRRCVRAQDCVPLAHGVTSAQGAAFYVNPLTALGIAETARRGGHAAIVHTAAASSLGQMLLKVCQADGTPLVAVVRSEAQADLLRALGAEHVCGTHTESFEADLLHAIQATGATVVFDAVGGGDLVSRILTTMERAALKGHAGFARYGSTGRKQAYIFGRLDTGPTILHRSYGAHWSVNGWLLLPFLEDIGEEVAARLRERVSRELTTTFANHYSRVISPMELLNPRMLTRIAARATGEKVLVDLTCPVEFGPTAS